MNSFVVFRQWLIHQLRYHWIPGLLVHGIQVSGPKKSITAAIPGEAFLYACYMARCAPADTPMSTIFPVSML
jgi:hypothetical protein